MTKPVSPPSLWPFRLEDLYPGQLSVRLRGGAGGDALPMPLHRPPAGARREVLRGWVEVDDHLELIFHLDSPGWLCRFLSAADQRRWHHIKKVICQSEPLKAAYYMGWQMVWLQAFYIKAPSSGSSGDKTLERFFYWNATTKERQQL